MMKAGFEWLGLVTRAVTSLPRRWLATSVVAVLTGCTGVPEGVEPVTGFEIPRYLGTWHEVARLDHSFERGLIDVTAEYTLNADGSVRVLNSGTDASTGERRSAQGVALPVGEPDVAHLKVSFFGPFYGSYIVFELDADYQYAFVSGFNTDYLWLLAREPQVDAAIRARFLDRAEALGFDTAELIWLSDDL